jgi:hypothetical protein
MQFLRREHSGANQAHLAHQHIEKLGKFVQAELTKYGARTRNTRIVLELEVAFKFGAKNRVGIQNRIRITPHRPELERVEFSVLANDPPAMENRPSIVNGNKKADDQEDWRKNENQSRRSQYVYTALEVTRRGPLACSRTALPRDAGLRGRMNNDLRLFFRDYHELTF